LGRGYFECGKHKLKGHRDGYVRKRLMIAQRIFDFHAQQLWSTKRPYCSAILDKLGVNSQELERLILETYVRGLSTRDIEDSIRSNAFLFA